MPFSILAALVFCGVTYGMAGLRNEASAVAEYSVINILMSLIATQVRLPHTAL